MNLLDRIKSLFTKRMIKQVDSWDGSESNYSTAEAYANASLINFNPVAGKGNDPENWVKSLIALPVREEGDGADTFVDRAIFAAAGGNGLTAVTKPDEVSEDDYNDLRERAGKEIIRAYIEMDRIAPQSIYEIADEDYPETRKRVAHVKRAIGMYSLLEQVYESLMLVDDAMDTESYLIDVFIEGGGLFAIFVQDGRIYKANISIVDDIVTLENYEDLTPGTEMMRGKQSVYRQADGRYRWVSIAATSALNRNGEIDSRALFDSFIAFARTTGVYPVLNFYHMGKNSRLGVADYLARDGNVYIASGTFDDNEYGRAAAKGIEKKPSYWGNSIEFLSISQDVYNVADIARIPIHVRGINTGITILPENQAATLLSTMSSVQRGVMREDIKQALLELMGDENLANEFEALVDSTNIAVSERIHRQVNDDEEGGDVSVNDNDNEVNRGVVPDNVRLDTPAVNDTLARGLLSDELFVGGIAEIAKEMARASTSNVAERVDELAESLAASQARVAELEVTVLALQTRYSQAEQATAEVEREREDDKPAVRNGSRARVNTTATRQQSYAETARQTLDTIFGK